MVVAGSYVGSGTEIDNSGNQNQQVWLANLPDMYHVKQVLKSDNSGSRNFHQNPPYKTNFSGFNSTYLDIPASYVEKYFILPEMSGCQKSSFR